MKLKAAAIGMAAVLAVGVSAVLVRHYATASSHRSSVASGVNYDPEAGMTNAQKEAYQDSNWSQTMTAYKGWWAKQNLTGVDLRALPIVPLDVLVDPAESTLPAAAQSASIIVQGHVQSWTINTSNGGVDLSISIDTSIKGSAAPTITTELPATMFIPSGDGGWGKFNQIGNIELQSNPAYPLFYPGDDVILFLDGAGNVQPITGEYQIRSDGSVAPSPASPFGSSIQGEPVSMFVNQIRAATAA